MARAGALPVQVRDAQPVDLPALVAIKGAGSEALHHDRLRDALSPGFRYLVLSVPGLGQSQTVIGAACLVFRRPASWSDAGDRRHLPQLVDLQILPAYRGQGYGSAFVHAIERITKAAGYGELYLSVEPYDNPRAYALYLRLGYHLLQPDPHRSAWQFIDSSGKLHQGEDWVVDMVKAIESLSPTPNA